MMDKALPASIKLVQPSAPGSNPEPPLSVLEDGPNPINAQTVRFPVIMQVVCKLTC